MFTGLIREFATVQSYTNNTLSIQSSFKTHIGDSIAINGACLTVTKLTPNGFEMELSKESRDLLAIENYNHKVHMEPAMQMGDRIDGHMVQGHVDCIGTINSIKKSENAWDFILKVPKEQMKYMIPKGSIAIDGVSLTINEVYDDSIRLTIIKHTMQNTLFASYQVKQRVNIETDMFARYIYHMFKPKASEMTWGDIDKIQALF